MLYRDVFEVQYAPLYDHFGMGTTIWSPLAGGILSGKYNDGTAPAESRYATTTMDFLQKKFQTLFGEENRAKTTAMLQGLGTLAGELDATQAQLCLAWAIKNKDVSTAMFGASRVSQVEDNLKAVEVMDRLTPEVLERIEGLLNNKPDTAFNFMKWSPEPARR
jgi:aryl-alcohol dehydrogenase-like predicted oxidoreductase